MSSSKLPRAGCNRKVDIEEGQNANCNGSANKSSVFVRPDSEQSLVSSPNAVDGHCSLVGDRAGRSGSTDHAMTRSQPPSSKGQKNAGVKSKGRIVKTVVNDSTAKSGQSLPENRLASFILSGKDVVVNVPANGNHRSMYLVPLTSVLVDLPKPTPRGKRQYPLVVVLVSSKIIAAIIHNDVCQLLRCSGRRAVTACCGVKYEVQRKQILRGCDLIIGTPQRLLAFVKEGKIFLQLVKLVVVDRVEDIDGMALKAFMESLPTKEHQICLFTSGMTAECQQCIRDYLRSDFLYSSLSKFDSQAAYALSAKHRVIDVSGASKIDYMNMLLKDVGSQYLATADWAVKVIIFMDSIATADKVVAVVKSQLPLAQIARIDSKQTIAERQQAIEVVKRGQIVVLLMCDAGSCEDFPFCVDYVVFHDIPAESEFYFQLVCTVGENGTVTTLYDRHMDQFKSLTILTALKNAKQKPPYWLCEDSLRAVVKSDL